MTLLEMAIYCLTAKMTCVITPMPVVQPDIAVVYICAPAYDEYFGRARRIVRFENGEGMKITAVMNCPNKANEADGVKEKL